MGYIAHNAIVVTGYGKADVYAAAKKARDLGLTVAGPHVAEVVNGYRSFLICPDGSKEGWNTSEEGDEKRQAWKVWARASDYGFEWCEVRYGHDDGRAALVTDAWMKP